MIEITRVVARQVRAVLRKVRPPGAGRGARPPLALHAGRDGLRVRACLPEAAVEFHQPGPRPADELTLPGEALDDFEGGKDRPVVLESVGPGTVRARWEDGGVPQAKDYQAPDADKLPPFPSEPAKLVAADAGLLKALDDASQVAARDSTRYALTRLQLRGGGEVVASDGRQLLVQGGLSFPWKEDVLVPALGAFGCKELPHDAPVSLGKTDTHLCLRVGPWTFHLAIDRDGRFPRSQDVIPSLRGSVTTCRLSPEDAAFLARALPRLPGGDDEHAPVTIDLDGKAAIRARDGAQGQVTELALTGSTVDGPAVRFVSNRGYLARAVQLGFGAFVVTKPEVPVVCREGGRTFVWMPLGKDGALPPSEGCLRISSGSDNGHADPPHQERRHKAVKHTPPNGDGNGHRPARHGSRATTSNGNGDGHAAPGAGGLDALVEEAQALQAALRDAHGRVSRLLAGLRRHRKSSKLLKSTLTSLKQLQQLDG